MHNSDVMQLPQSAQALQLLDALPVGCLVLAVDLTVCFWNQLLEEWTGMPRQQVLGRPVADVVPNLASSRYLTRIRPVFDGGPPVIFSPQLHPHLIPAPRPDSQQRIQQTTVTALQLDGVTHLLFAVQDVTDLVLTARESRLLHQQALQDIEQRKAAEVAQREGAERLRAIVENAVEAIIVMDVTGTVEEFNAAAERLFGYEASEVIGKNVSMLMPEPDHSSHDTYVQRYLQTGQRRIIGIGREVVGLRKDGSVFPMRLAVSETTVGGQRHFTGIIHDITAQKQLEEHLRTLSMRDGLTGISNRRSFDEALEKEWCRERRQAKPLSLILADIDCFKRYNDSYGHQAGDACLKAVADCLAASVHRAGDLVARYGGEEFVVLLPETPLEDARLVAEHIRQNVLALAITHGASEAAAVVTLSLGVAGLVPGQRQSSHELLGLADQALYTAKFSGRNRVCVAEAP